MSLLGFVVLFRWCPVLQLPSVAGHGYHFNRLKRSTQGSAIGVVSQAACAAAAARITSVLNNPGTDLDNAFSSEPPTPPKGSIPASRKRSA